MKTNTIRRNDSGHETAELPSPVMHKARQFMRGMALPRWAACLAAVTCLTIGTPQLQAVPAPDANSVLMLDTTVSGGGGSLEATEAASAGFTVVVVNAATWATTTLAEFKTYRALVLGDPNCTGVVSVAPAEANRAIWSAAVNGNIIVFGTDEALHANFGDPARSIITKNGISFAGNIATKTGLFCSLSCYYHGTAPSTPVTVLDQFGVFTVTGVGCYNDAHIVATHPALTGITDALLSGWGCSVHEAFDGFPASFLPLAIARDPAGGPPFPGSLAFPDGSHGVPYILARGEGLVLITNITLTPATADNPVGTIHTVTATVVSNTPSPGTPVVGTTVTFLVTSGPNAGATGTGVTDALGKATFSYTSNGIVGTDTIKATFVDASGATQTSNTAVKNWVKPPNTPPDVSKACPSLDCLWPPNHKFVPITIGCVTDAEGDPITIVVTSITSDEPTATIKGAGGAVTHVPDASGVGTKTASVRAERSGTADGRVYEITFSASDGKDSSIGKVRVKVPHDQSVKTCPAVDNGQIYDATQSN